jgi:exosortase A
MEFRLNKLSSSHQLLLMLASVLIAWIVVFWQGLVTAIDIWLISDIFNHCLFVLPGAFYLIYLKRAELASVTFKPAGLGLFFCTGSALVYVVGIAGDVQLFMHLATFSFLPFAIWAFIGNSAANKILFPLFFIVFCIPFGEEFIPALQKITADLAVMMLNWTSIPIFRSGLYIEIPQGRFLVAEACSGISFFIASVVIGSLYSYLNIRSVKRRISFVLISIFVPIIANAVRVFGIIVIGHLSDMEYAVGADHLIYGWFFFAFVLILLLGIGELVREKRLTGEAQTVAISNSSFNYSKSKFLVLCFGFVCVFSVSHAWIQVVNAQSNNIEIPAQIDTAGLSSFEVDSGSSQWKPKFNDAFDTYSATIEIESNQIDIFLAWYPKGRGEMISSLHRFYQEKEWTLESTERFSLDSSIELPLSTIVGSRGYRILTFWYVIDGQVFTDKKRAKLYEIYRLMFGTHSGGGVVVVSQDIDLMSKAENSETFKRSVQKGFSQLNGQFSFQ